MTQLTRGMLHHRTKSKISPDETEKPQNDLPVAHIDEYF
jgi:hypothetical protein